MVLPEAQYDPEEKWLGTDRFWVTVGVPCSGYEGIGLMAVYLVVYLTLFRQHLRFPRAFLLVPLALAAVWLANVVRLAALVWIGDRVSPSLAIGGFHSQAGWVGFNVVAAGLLVLAHRSRLFTRDDSPRATGPDPTSAYLAPLLVALVVQMLAAALSPTARTPLSGAGARGGCLALVLLAAVHGAADAGPRAGVGRAGLCAHRRRRGVPALDRAGEGRRALRAGGRDCRAGWPSAGSWPR